MSIPAATNSTAARPIPPDSNLDLNGWFDPEQVASRLAPVWDEIGRSIQSCEIGHVRYRPEHRCTICYRVAYRGEKDNHEVDIYVSVLTQGGFRRLREKLTTPTWLTGVEAGKVIILPEARAVVFEFPYDADLPTLKLAQSGQELARVLYPALADSVPNHWIPHDKLPSIEVLRYKPESRLVCRCDAFWQDPKTSRTVSRPIVLRFEHTGRVAVTFDKMNKLSLALSDEPTVGLPEALFCLEGRGVIGMQAVEGARLSEILQTTEANSGLKRAARLLAKLHGCRISGDSMGIGVTFQARVEQTVRLLSCASPDIASLAQETGGRLDALDKSTQPGPIGTVHGDFHQGQVLCGADRTWVVDVDGAGAGETATDLGNFLAQLRRLQLRGRLDAETAGAEVFIGAYQSEAGVTVDHRRLTLWTGLGLLELAAKDFRRLRIGWPKSVMRILHECATVLAV